MSLDPELGPANTEHLSRPAPAPVRYSAARHANHVDESPELLRWRADLLMDEMMLGGVDVSAADGVAPRATVRDSSRFDPGYPADNGMADHGGSPGRTETDWGARAIYPSPGGSRPTPTDAAPPPDNRRVDVDRQRGDTDAGRSDPVGSPREDAQPRHENRNGSALSDSRRPVEPPARPEPTSYRQVRADETAGRPPARDTDPPRNSSERPRPPARATAPPVDTHTQWAHSAEKWDWQDFGAQEVEPEYELEDDDIPAPFTEYRPQDRQSEPRGAVRQDSADYVNAMSVVGHGKRRSTLLPRMTNLDPEALNREIAELHGAIGTLLPAGHETGERARHLLDKAYSILQSDPLRSAEVEYYMQQVRTIVQRLRQTRTWSDLYRDRLRVYLMGWAALSAILFTARYVFQLQSTAMLAGLTGLGSGSLTLQHWPALLGAATAGALGGSIGALYTMRQHAATGDSFFDRKYGLRGLMLPLLGLIVGGLGYLFFGGAYWLADVNPATNLLAGMVPALAAFVFGVSQESIYGTRG